MIGDWWLMIDDWWSGVAFVLFVQCFWRPTIYRLALSLSRHFAVAPSIQQTQAVLVQFQQHPQAWTRVDTILEKSQNNNTKMIALKILEDAVKFRWNVLPKQQREGIRSFIVNMIITISRDREKMKAMSALLNRLNIVLIQVSTSLFYFPPTQDPTCLFVLDHVRFNTTYCLANTPHNLVCRLSNKSGLKTGPVLFQISSTLVEPVNLCVPTTCPFWSF